MTAASLYVVLEGPRAGHYRELAESLLGPHGRVAYVDCSREITLADRERALDVLLPDATAVVVTPWLGGTAPGLELPAFDLPRWARAPRLKAITGTFDFRLAWIDPDEAARRGVVLADTSRTMTPTVAEFGVAMTLNLLRWIPDQVELVRRGDWLASPPGGGHFVYGDLAGRRVRLAGYGSINRHYRRLISSFECDVRTYDPFIDNEMLHRDGVERATSLADLAADAEIFVVAIPPTPDTIGVVSANVLEALPTGSLFVLLSRMAVVNQEALWRRVRADELRVAVDVFEPEPPPPDAWLRTAPNVLPTPHIAGNAVYAHQRCFIEACRDAVRGVAGDAPHHPATTRDKQLYAGTLTSPRRPPA